jgi:hypothetical protein
LSDPKLVVVGEGSCCISRAIGIGDGLGKGEFLESNIQKEAVEVFMRFSVASLSTRVFTLAIHYMDR